MHNSDYYREQADHYRQLAASADDPAAKQEFLNWQQRVNRLPIRWMTVEQVGKWRSDKLLVSPAIKRTDVTDFATTMMRPS